MTTANPEDAEPARCPRASVDQPAPRPQATGDYLDGACNGLGMLGHRRNDLRILGVHQADEFQGGQFVQSRGIRILGFGGQVIQRRMWIHL